MNRPLKYLLCIIFLTSVTSLPSGKLKNNNNGYKFWNLKSVSGLLSLEGNYRSGTYSLTDYFEDERNSLYLNGKIDLFASGFFFHPNFFQLDANLSYSPSKNLDEYVISPDNSEINTNEKVYLNGTFFQERSVSVNPYFNYIHSFSRREFTTNIESNYLNYGTGLYGFNTFLPFNINISKSIREEEEKQTNRTFKTDQFAINSEFIKSIGDINNNRLNIDYLNYSRNYTHNRTVHNKSISWNLSNNLLVNRPSNFNLSSVVSLNNSTGSQPFNRLLITENIRTNLPAGFMVSGRYMFYDLSQEIIKSSQHNAEGRLAHQLFESLNSYLSYNYINITQTFYDENINRGEIGFNYVKKVPTGNIGLNYNYTLSKHERLNYSTDYVVIDESVLLSDEEIALLNYPFVNKNSIIVRNTLRTIIYQENFDYILIQRGNYIEIQRIPGGQIANNEIVFVSYTAEQQPSLNFSTSINRYGINVTLLNNFLNIYFNGTDQSYSDISTIDYNYLKNVDQKIYGIKLSYDFIDIGTEYENYQSNITPFKSSRYFARLYAHTKFNLIASLNGSHRIYNLLDDNSNQHFTDLSISLAYAMSSRSRLSFYINSIIQNGRQIDLDINIFRVEFLTSYRQMDITFGYENYYRKLLLDITKYSGAFIKIARRF